MKVKTVSGAEVEIPESEVERIRDETSRHHEKETYAHRNHEYLEKALGYIKSVTGKEPDSGKTLTEVLDEHLRLGSKKEMCLLTAVIAAMIGMHSKEIHKD